MADRWSVLATNQVLPTRQAGQVAGWGREVTFFSLCNKTGSGKVLRINEVRVGDSTPVAKSATVARFVMHRVTGIVSGPIEVRAMPFSDYNERLPTEIRAYYAYQSPLTLPPNNALSAWSAADWQQLSIVKPYIWDEAINTAYAAATADEVAGWMQRTTCLYMGGRESNVQRITIRPGEALTLSVYDALADDADFRCDVLVIFEVADS
jgi:hypothetical protein